MKGVCVILSTLLGTALALDLIGCRGRPKVIDVKVLQLEGDIYSPGFQEGVNYPDDLFCEYTIKAPYGFRIRLTFEHLDLEVFDLCEKDGLEIYEGDSHMNPVHGVFCGNGSVPDIVSGGNALHIVFRTDFMVRKKGFHLKYRASVSQSLCGRTQRPCRNRNCFSTSQECDGVDDCGDGTDEENCGMPLAVTACGLREIFSDSDVERVVGGKEATPGSWPWQADLQLSYIYPNGHMCGGTLINAEWILSAAHCFEGNDHPNAWRVHLGKHNKYRKDEYEQVRYVERLIVYPDLTGEKLEGFYVDLEHDIALMKLNAPVKFTKYVRPACLPDLGYNLKPNTKCVGTGWGMTRGTGSSSALKEVDLWIEKDEACTVPEEMGGLMNNKTMICVSNRKGYQDVCHGDSGGPLVCEMNSAWHVVGATSHGTAGTHETGLCGLPGSYTVYAKVSDKTKWIRKMIDTYSFH